MTVVLSVIGSVLILVVLGIVILLVVLKRKKRQRTKRQQQQQQSENISMGQQTPETVVIENVMNTGTVVSNENNSGATTLSTYQPGTSLIKSHTFFFII